eukprot:3078448-Amphidinium_carterae.1
MKQHRELKSVPPWSAPKQIHSFGDGCGEFWGVNFEPLHAEGCRQSCGIHLAVQHHSQGSRH